MLVLPRPQALFLDFGGVVAQTTTRPGWIEELAEEVDRLLEPAEGAGLSVAEIAVDIRAAAAADTAWKAAMSRLQAPRELTAAEFWADFVASDWTGSQRQVVTDHAALLCYRMGVLRASRIMRPGIDELLQAACVHDIAVAVVSNALSGAVHRDFLAEQGLTHHFATQVYSDEAGVRKPNPELILFAARTLHIAVRDVWYVGDTLDRDVLCARRAGAGMTILMESSATYQVPYQIRQQPDLVVADPQELTAHLVATCLGTNIAR
ncbi:MAG: HAD-IA family hydrolase [Nakamurella sp.]